MPKNIRQEKKHIHPFGVEFKIYIMTFFSNCPTNVIVFYRPFGAQEVKAIFIGMHSIPYIIIWYAQHTLPLVLFA